MNEVFRSFFMGGFECATHRRSDGLQIDVIASSGHDKQAAADYRILNRAGVHSVRDGLRWHLIESAPGVYDWSSFLPMLDASIAERTEVIWDLCHWGLPQGLDVFSDEFPARFAAFAKAAALLVKSRTPVGVVPFYCAMNEISFWAWVGGDVGAFYPYSTGRGGELKRQLVRAAVAGMRAILSVDSNARFVQAEPVINIVPELPEAVDEVGRHNAGQYEAWDMLCGRLEPELGGTPEVLDIIGVNYYWNNQWINRGERAPLGHLCHRPFHEMLLDLWMRYRRPIVISETGAERGSDIGWLGYIAAEVREAQRQGAVIAGLCLYPVMDYPGWDDDRHCHCGLIEVENDWGKRSLRDSLALELAVQEQLREAASALHVVPSKQT